VCKSQARSIFPALRLAFLFDNACIGSLRETPRLGSICAFRVSDR